MSWFEQLISKFRRRKTRRTAEPTAIMHFLEQSRWVTALIFCVTVIAIVIISSAGLSTAYLPIFPNQLATVRITAAVPFSYGS